LLKGFREKYEGRLIVLHEEYENPVSREVALKDSSFALEIISKLFR